MIIDIKKLRLKRINKRFNLNYNFKQIQLLW